MARRRSNAAANTPLEDQIKTIRFGVEIESYGLNIPAAAAVMQSVIGGNIHRESAYQRRYCLDAEGRKWSIVYDGSVSGGFEFVSPICSIEQGDIETIQKLIRAFRAAGARPTSGTGMHIHIDATDGGTGLDTSQAIARFAKMFYAREELFCKAFEASDRLQDRWCRPMDPAFIERMTSGRNGDASRRTIANAYYGRNEYHPSRHYDSSRYRGVNLHATFTRGTVELRYFHAPIRHAGKFRAQLLFVLACAAKARNGRHTTAKKVQIAHGNEKYAMRSYMLKLGMSGDYFKVSREHLLKPLSGNASRARPARPAAEPAQAEPRRELSASERALADQPVNVITNTDGSQRYDVLDNAIAIVREISS